MYKVDNYLTGNSRNFRSVKRAFAYVLKCEGIGWGVKTKDGRPVYRYESGRKVFTYYTLDSDGGETLIGTF